MIKTKTENYKVRTDLIKDQNKGTTIKQDYYKIPKLSTPEKPLLKLTDNLSIERQLKIIDEQVNHLSEQLKELQKIQRQTFELISLYEKNLDKRFEFLFENSESI